MSHTGLERMRPLAQNGSTLRADLIAADIFKRAAVEVMLNVHGMEYDDGPPSYKDIADYAFNAAAVLVAEARRRDAHTGELVHPTDGLPDDE